MITYLYKKSIVLCFVVALTGIAFTSCEKKAGYDLTKTSTSTAGSNGSSASNGNSGSGSSTGSSTGNYIGIGDNGNGIGNTSWGGNGMIAGGGSGSVPIPPVNTIIFRVNNDTTYLWPSKFPPLSYTQINVGAKSSTLYNDFELRYGSLSAGTYKNVHIAINISRITGNNYAQISLASLHNTLVVTAQVAAGSTQSSIGTFDGYMKDYNSKVDSVRVVGSFNISQ